MNYKKTACATLLFAATINSGDLFANGIALNENSTSGLGTASAGRTSSAKDASTLHGHPAGMYKLNGTEIVAGMTVLRVKGDINDVRTTAGPGTNKGDMVPTQFVPNGYIVTPLNDRWHAGFGFYVPYGMVSDYENGFQGAGHGLYSSLKVVTLQPTVSYKINDRLAVGLGITFNRMTSTLSEDLETYNLPNALGGPFGTTRMRTHGDDDAWGYNVGVLWDITDRTRFGATYHSKTDFNLDGNTNIYGFPNLGLAAGPANAQIPLGDIANREYKSKVKLDMPDMFDLSFTHKLNDRWTIMAGATWIHWSRWNSVIIRNQDMNPILGYYLSNVSEQFYFKNTWSEAVGVTYQLNPKWELRAGFAFDSTPYKNKYRGVRLPTGNRKDFTVGAGYSPNKDLSFDTALGIFKEDNSVNKPSRTDLGAELQPEYHAHMKGTAYGLSLGMTQRF